MSARANRRLRGLRGVPAGIPYGFRELKSLYPRLLWRALLTAMALHVSIIGTASFILSVRGGEKVAHIVVFPRPNPAEGDTFIVTPLPPPPIESTGSGPVRPMPADIIAAIPVPTPDTLVTVPLTVPSVDDWRYVLGSATAADGASFEPGEIAESSSTGTEEASPPVWVSVEEMPVLVSIPKPVYPAIARQAGIEGTVLIRAVVESDGSVGSAQVMRGVPLLDEAALSAVRAAVFKPGIQAHKPVRVSVDIPIRFRLE